MTPPSPSPYAFTPAQEDTPKVSRWARAILTVLLALLARSAFRDEYGTVPLISDITVAIHEFGHMLFMPFGVEFLGHTMMILGGSLTQVALPLIFMIYFLRARPGRHDVHAAMVCLWWTSISLLGVAIYAADARAGQLMLITGQTGQESDGHDFENLFRTWGVLDKDTIIAARIRAVAALLCFTSIVLGLYAAWKGEPDPAPAEMEADAET